MIVCRQFTPITNNNIWLE